MGQLLINCNGYYLSKLGIKVKNKKFIKAHNYNYSAAVQKNNFELTRGNNE